MLENMKDVDRVFCENIEKLRRYELSMKNVTKQEFIRNKKNIKGLVDEIVKCNDNKIIK